MRNHYVQGLSFIVVVLCALTNCGGGTAGTSSTGGDIKLRIVSGTISQADGEAATGVEVALLGGDPATATDAQGMFEFQAETDTQITLSLTTQGNVIELEIPEIAPDTQIVTVDAQLNEDQTAASAQTVEGNVSVANSCRQYAVVRGDQVALNLPIGRVECSLEYLFFANIPGLERAFLQVETNNCGGTTFTTSGTQADSSEVSIFQIARVNNQRGICTAKVQALLPGVRTNQTFTIKVQQQADTNETPSDPLRASYEGTLQTDPRQPQSENCPHFDSARTRLRFSVSGALLSANFLSEGVRLNGRVRSHASSNAEKYVVSGDISRTASGAETVSVYPLSPVGSPRASFALEYTQRDSQGSVVCQRSFAGLLSLQN